MKHLSILIALWLLPAAGCSPDSPSSQPSPPGKVNTVPDTRIQTFQNEDGTWGYDIFLDDRRFIHQPHKPAVGGQQGFATRQQAQKVAELVTGKIRQGTMPPSVRREEIDSLLQLFR